MCVASPPVGQSAVEPAAPGARAAQGGRQRARRGRGEHQRRDAAPVRGVGRRARRHEDNRTPIDAIRGVGVGRGDHVRPQVRRGECRARPVRGRGRPDAPLALRRRRLRAARRHDAALRAARPRAARPRAARVLEREGAGETRAEKRQKEAVNKAKMEAEMAEYKRLQQEKKESESERGLGGEAFRRPSSKQRFRIATPGGGTGGASSGGGTAASQQRWRRRV